MALQATSTTLPAPLASSDAPSTTAIALSSADIMRVEIELFESFLRRWEICPAPRRAQQQVISSDGSAPGTRGTSRQTQSRGRPPSAEVGTLNVAQKLLVARREVDASDTDIAKSRELYEKMLDELKALREETDIRIAELKKEAYEFRRDIVAGAVQQQTGKLSSAAMQAYFELKLRAKQAMIEKVASKNASMKAQLTKLEKELQKKEDQGEQFVPIDFKQLKIENQQFSVKIEKLNLELLDLKVKAGGTVQIVNKYKKKLEKVLRKNSYRQQHIAQQDEILQQIAQESTVVEQEIKKASASNQKLRQQQEEYQVPEVLDYVKLKAELYELDKKVADWQRKVEIADLALKRLRTATNKTALAQSEPGSLRNSAANLTSSAGLPEVVPQHASPQEAPPAEMVAES